MTLTLAGVHSIGTANLVSWSNEAQGTAEWWTKAVANADGQLRDRPASQGRAVRPESDWMARDFRDRYAAALEAGFDFVWLDMLVSHLTKLQSAVAGAAMAGIKVALKPDGNSWSAGIDAGAGFDTEAKIVAEAVRHLVTLYKVAPDAMLRLDDGRVVIGPYHAELWPASRWSAILDGVEAALGIKTAFAPDFANTTPIAGFASAMGARIVAAGIWGDRNPAQVRSRGASTIAATVAAGLKVVQYTATQDERPRESRFDEAANTETLRATYDLVMSSPAVWMTQHATLDDYFEGAHLEGSDKRGPGWLFLSSYFIRRAKLGRDPVVTTDAVFLSHRLQPWQAKPTAQTLAVMALRSGSTPARDMSEVLVFLTAPAAVSVDGAAPVTYPAGMSVLPLVALKVGAKHRVTVTRNGAVVVDVSSRTAAAAALPAQTLDYVMTTNVTSSAWHAADDVEALQARLDADDAQLAAANDRIAVDEAQLAADEAKIAAGRAALQ